MDLVERDEDLATLGAQWRRAREGTGGFVVIGGESGAGKTTLVQAFAQDVAAPSPVLWGACDPLSTPRPLGPLHDVAHDLGEPVLSLLRGTGQSYEIFPAVFERLRARPCVLVVDDLHWADQGTIDLLRFLLRRIHATSSLVVGTVRSDEIGAGHLLRALLGDVARSPVAVTVELPPLSEDAVRELVAGGPLDPVSLHRLTGGNAFFVTEMLHHDGTRLPGTVRDAILARTAGLDDDARGVLDLLACAPESIPDRLLTNLGIGVPPLRALAEAGLIARGRRGIAFRHDLCRMALAGSIPPGGEVALHQRMLDALEALPDADPAVLCHHALGADDAPAILRHASAAGTAAARASAHTQAATFFRAALDRGGPITADQEADLLERLADELYLADRLDEAIAASRRAMDLRLETRDSSRVSANHQAISIYQWYSANRPAAERHASDAVTVLDHSPDPGRLGHALAHGAYLALQANDVDLGRSLADQARRLAAEVDDPLLDMRIGVLDGIGLLLDGETSGRNEILALVEADPDHFDEVVSSGYSNLVYFDVEQRRLHDAETVLDRSLPLAVERDIPICRVWQLGTRGRLRMMAGDWTSAVADADSVLGAPSAPLARTWPHLVRALVALRRGDDIGSDLDQAWELAARLGEPLRVLPAVAAVAEQAWLTGHDDDRVAAGPDLLRQHTEPGLEWARGDLALWLRRIDPATEIPAGAYSTPHRLQLEGQHGAAARHWDELGHPYERALALVETGGRDAARTGLDLLDRLGADAVAARLRHDLRHRGMTSVPTRRRPTTVRNPAGLTARQVDVLRLLAEGLTNAELAQRLYISPKTADHHVSAILTKLRVTNRRHAAQAAHDLGILDER